MAKQVITELVCDLSGGPAAETVSFALDGRSYEIDLSADHALELREALAEYVHAARKAGGKASSAPKERMSKEEAQAIRTWAAQNGFQPASRGRLPSAMVEAYRAAA